MLLNLNQSKKLPLTELSDHQFVADLINVEGPLLSLYRTDHHQDFLYKWCDSYNNDNNWLVFSINRAQLRAYISSQIPLLDIIKSSNKIFLLKARTTDEGVEYKNLWSADIRDLPQEYLPLENALFDRSFANDSLSTLAAPSMHEVKIDGNWYLDDFGRFQSVYSQLYSFFYALKNIERPSIRSSLKHSLTAYPWKGGFSAINIFKEIFDATPEFHQARVKSLSYASPGDISMELLESVAIDIRSLVDRANADENQYSLYEISKKANKFLDQNELRNVSGKNEAGQLANLDPSTLILLEGHVDSLTNALGLSQALPMLKELGANNLVILKLLLAIFRRYKKLKEFQASGLITSL